jgi:hypothetical protein
LVGLPPDFLLSLMALSSLMRLSLLKAAHVDVGERHVAEIRVARLFRPTYAEANVGHPSSLVLTMPARVEWVLSMRPRT